MFERDRLFIGGEWAAPKTADVFDVVCPSTEEVVGRVPAATPADVDAAVAAARASFDAGTWRSTPPAERGRVLARVAEILRARSEETARLITTELGVPISSSLEDQVLQPVATLEYYAALADEFPFEDVRSVRRRSLVVHDPIGVVAAVVPWNAPLRSVVNKLAPALLAGCSVVVKPAEDTPLSAYHLAEAIREAGIPPGVVSILAGGRDVGEYLVRHPGVDKISFTGSTVAGRRIMGIAAERLARVSLELGGKSAAIVLDDADLDVTLKRLVPMAIGNTGQACNAMTRVLVSRARHDEFVEALCTAMASWIPGDPFDPATRLGPLVSARQLDRVLGYLEIAQQEGAKAALGGGRPAHLPVGYYVEPTVLTGVTNTMRVAREEIFGPVVSVLAYEGVDEAVAIANDSDYGLSGSVWTADEEAGLSLARRLRTGQVRVNGAAQAIDAPFGGFKQSGFGREYGPEGLRAFLETKAIAFRPPKVERGGR